MEGRDGRDRGDRGDRGDRVALAAGQASSGQAAKPAAAPEAPPSVDGTWPREVKTSIGVVTVYQPQPEDVEPGLDHLLPAPPAQPKT